MHRLCLLLTLVAGCGSASTASDGGVHDLACGSRCEFGSPDGNGASHDMAGSPSNDASAMSTRLSFAPAVAFGAGTPVALAIGDFDGDKKIDIAVVSGANTVSVILGKGDGTFGVAVPTTCPTAQVLVAADFNNDKRSDLLAGTGGNAYLLLATGGGAFQAPTAVINCASNGTTTCSQSMAVGDLNNDQKPDAVGAGYYQIGSSGTMQTLQAVSALDSGSGVLNQVGSFPASSTPSGTAGQIKVADFNGDGKLDLALVNIGNYMLPAHPSVNLLLGNGDGTFQAPLERHIYSGVGRVFALGVADLNNDGKADLVVGDNVANVALGNGDGSFQGANTYSTGGPPNGFAIADFNGDGRLDIATPSVWSESATVLLGNGDGTFGDSLNYFIGSQPTDIGFGDFNGDGKPDLAITNTNAVMVLINTTT